MNRIKRFFTFDKGLFTHESRLGKLNVFALLFPILFESVMLNLQGTVNTAILSDYSDNAVAAVGVANSVISVVSLIGTVISIGATVVISIAIGEENLKKTRELTFTSLAVCFGFALVITPLLLVLKRGILAALNIEGEILSLASDYFTIRMSFFVFTMMTTAITAQLRCYGYPKYTFIIGFITNIINLLLNVLVVYFPEYSPLHGVVGVAVSVVISNGVGLIISFVVMAQLRISMSPPGSLHTLFSYVKSILKIGLPAGLSNMMYTASQMITTSFVALIGDWALTAKVYYMNILSYAYLFSHSAGNANALMVGRCQGEGDLSRPDKMNRQLVKLTVAVNLIVSLSVLIFGKPLVGIFTSDVQILTVAIGVFAVDIVAEQARAVSQVYEYALRAAGDIMFSTVAVAISCVTFSLGIAYVLAIPLGLGLVGCWIGVALDEVTRAVVTYLRWRSGVWKSKKI